MTRERRLSKLRGTAPACSGSTQYERRKRRPNAARGRDRAGVVTAKDTGDGPPGLDLKEVGDAVHLRVHVKPRAKISRVGEVRHEALDVAVNAPPTEGAANAALVETLARHFGLPRRAVSIVSGFASRAKLVRLDGISAADVLNRLNG
jgi:uncharacterized protein (TIGR00251 family)